jgi:hypothetical protein
MSWFAFSLPLGNAVFGIVSVGTLSFFREELGFVVEDLSQAPAMRTPLN